MSAVVRVGVAGFDYRDWRGTVYPEPRPRNFDPIAYLARYVDLIEINASFYGPPSAKTAASWVERVRDHARFSYTAKLWRRFTHERTTSWSRDDSALVHAGFAPLQESGRLDAVLLQFPWSYRNDEHAREWLADVTDEFARYPLVVEVRHESWNTPEFHAWLIERGVGFVNVDQPVFRRSIKPSAHATSATGYVRVHGRNYSDWFRKNASRDERYDYLYSAEELGPWVERTKSIAAESVAKKLAVVFNNHFRGQELVNALQFRSMIEQSPVEIPPTLFDTYPGALAPYKREHTA